MVQETQTLKGFKDIHPEEGAHRYALLNTIMDQASHQGYQVVETPTIEYSETILGQGGETDKQVYRFQDGGGRDVALRFDLTMSFARYIATYHNQLGLPFKRIQFGQVFRGEKPQRGRYREFTQCDVDIVGGDDILTDGEILRFFGSVFHSLPIDPVVIEVGHRKTLTAILKSFTIPEARHQETLILIDKLDKIGAQKLIQLLCQDINLTEDQAQDLLKCLDTIEAAAERLSAEEKQDLTRLQDMIEALNDLYDDQVQYQLNLSIARGLGYYTGMVFETKIKGDEKLGSVASGGRYNDLCGRFTKETLNGVGGSFGIDRILSSSGYRPLTNQNQNKIKVLLMDPKGQKYAFGVQKKLGQAGLHFDATLQISKPGKMIQKAIKKGFDFGIIIGEKEIQSQTYSCKDFRKNEQKSFDSMDKLIEFIHTSARS